MYGTVGLCLARGLLNSKLCPRALQLMDGIHSGRTWEYHGRISESFRLTYQVNNADLRCPKWARLPLASPHLPIIQLGLAAFRLPQMEYLFLTCTSPVTGFRNHGSQAPASAARSQSASSGLSCVRKDLRLWRQILVGALDIFELWFSLPSQSRSARRF